MLAWPFKLWLRRGYKGRAAAQHALLAQWLSEFGSIAASASELLPAATITGATPLHSISLSIHTRPTS